MKKIVLLGIAALTLASCAPSQGAKPIVYQAKSNEILATIAQIAPTIQPNRTTNYFSITGLTPSYISLSAQPVGALKVLNVLGGSNVNDGTVQVTFTALENGNTTSVTSSSSDSSGVKFISTIYAELDRKFTRVSTP